VTEPTLAGRLKVRRMKGIRKKKNWPTCSMEVAIQ
jgi:hypothetical protein